MQAVTAPPTPAVQYLRMSTEHQRYSLQNQAAVVAAFASARGFEITRTYADPGRSGLTLAGRPGLKQLLSDVLQPDRTFQAVLVLDVTRWGRFQDPDQAAYYEYLCRAAGVPVIYCAEPFQSDQSFAASIMKQLKRVMAGEYSRELGTKVAFAQARLAGEGLWQGGPPGYGLRRQAIQHDGTAGAVLQAGHWKPDVRGRVVLVAGPDDELEVVRRIYRLFVTGGMSRAEVSRTLNREGVAAEGGSRWSPRRVHQVLTNEKYVGVQVFGRTTRLLRGPSVRRASHDWTRVPGVLEPIVSREMFDLAARNIAVRCRVLSDEEMVEGLRRLLAREGKLTAALLAAEEDLPGPDAYRRRWGGLVAAFAEAGYVPSARARKAGEATRGNRLKRRLISSPPPSDEILLMELRRFLHRNGRLTIQLMRDEPGLPSPEVYRRAFGSMARVYELVGYRADDGQLRGMANMARRRVRRR